MNVIVAQEYKLWKRNKRAGRRSNEPIRLPFKFQLPSDTPPSCQLNNSSFLHSWGYDGAVGYMIEVVAIRNGFFKKNRYVRRPLVVLPKDQKGAPIRQEIGRLGVDFPKRKREFKKKMRRHIFGRAAKVHMQVRRMNHNVCRDLTQANASPSSPFRTSIRSHFSPRSRTSCVS